MSVTLEAIQAKQAELATMIAALAAAKPPASIDIEETTIQLAAGEHYAGLVLHENGTPSHHLVLLPGEAEDVPWDDAISWAKGKGALPTRQEQALLYANCKGKFVATWYWSSEQHEDNGSAAWYQNFDYGDQLSYHKSAEGRARAVRRLSV